MAEILTKKAPRERTKRTPIAQRNILTVEGRDPDYSYRIVNDTGDRIQAFKDAGYEMVLAKDVRVGDKRINSAAPEGSYAQVSVGAGQKAFVMKVPKEWYEEDQQAKQAKINALEQTMKSEALAQNTLRNGKLELTRE